MEKSVASIFGCANCGLQFSVGLVDRMSVRLVMVRGASGGGSGDRIARKLDGERWRNFWHSRKDVTARSCKGLVFGMCLRTEGCRRSLMLAIVRLASIDRGRRLQALKATGKTDLQPLMCAYRSGLGLSFRGLHPVLG